LEATWGKGFAVPCRDIDWKVAVAARMAVSMEGERICVKGLWRKERRKEERDREKEREIVKVQRCRTKN